MVAPLDSVIDLPDSGREFGCQDQFCCTGDEPFIRCWHHPPRPGDAHLTPDVASHQPCNTGALNMAKGKDRFANIPVA